MVFTQEMLIYICVPYLYLVSREVLCPLDDDLPYKRYPFKKRDNNLETHCVQSSVLKFTALQTLILLG